MKRERIFYLDFIRALAVILILLTHYNALFLYMNPQPLDKVVVTYRICNLYIGDFGVSLFFIISGAALMYVYENKLDLPTFYKKRFVSIYPMFWIAYTIAFVIQKVIYHVDFSAVPRKNFILTILGFDGYYSGVMPTFYIIGEWFLGAIILIYILFPVLRWGVNKHPVACGGLLFLFYLLALVCYNTQLSKAELIAVRIPEFYFGMMYIKYIKKTNWKVALAALVVLGVNTVIAPTFDSNIQTTYVGIMAFLLLTFISQFVNCAVICKICQFFSKYCYPIFLIHHFIIYKITDKVDFYAISKWENCGVFSICVAVILISSILLYYLEAMIKSGATRVRKKVSGAAKVDI